MSSSLNERAAGPRLAVVTGAASGIGLAAARMLLERGAAVVAVDRDAQPPALAGRDDVTWIRGDVAADETWTQVGAACRARDAAGADALVACAGAIVVKPFLDTPLDDWRRLFDVNVLGVVRALQALLPPMVARGDGAVAVVCSVDSFAAEEQMSAYATSKAALLHAVRSAALEHARDGLRINAVCPGVIDTPLLRQHLGQLDDPEGERAALARRTPAGRILRAEEVAEALWFLVGPGATGLSGASIVVDGGLTTAIDFSA